MCKDSVFYYYVIMKIIMFKDLGYNGNKRLKLIVISSIIIIFWFFLVQLRLAFEIICYLVRKRKIQDEN